MSHETTIAIRESVTEYDHAAAWTERADMYIFSITKTSVINSYFARQDLINIPAEVPALASPGYASNTAISKIFYVLFNYIYVVIKTFTLTLNDT